MHVMVIMLAVFVILRYLFTIIVKSSQQILKTLSPVMSKVHVFKKLTVSTALMQRFESIFLCLIIQPIPPPVDKPVDPYVCTAIEMFMIAYGNQHPTAGVPTGELRFV